jgi:cellobiose phosphorylase/cellobionic acid phosphorylase
VQNGRCSGDPCLSEFPVGALHHDIELAPGESTRIGFFVGIERNQADVQALQTQYASVDAFDAALDKVRARDADQQAQLKIETPDTVLNGFFNNWLQKQIIFQSRLNRLAGGFPIRNQLQDCMGLALIDPETALDYLRTRLPLQNADGYLRQWWTAGDGDQSEVCALDYQDGGVWLVICTLIIANQNASPDFLNERCGFYDSEEQATILEHLIRAVRRLETHRGAHGLCLFGDGDWTDPINGPGRKGRGESTWTTCALGVAVQMLHEVMHNLAREDDCAWLRNLDQALNDAVHEHCWNGSWLITGFDDDGIAIGTPEDSEGRFFLNCQTWAIMAGYVNETRLSSTIEAMRSLETAAGARLLAPAFTQWNERWGRISVKQPGTSENGSIYCHAGMFKAYADCRLGNGSATLREIVQNLPLNPSNPPSKNSQAPIYVPNFYYGIEDTCEFGVSSRHHTTGTAPWMLWVMVESILGIRATPHGLAIDPCMPDEWDTARVVRQFGGSNYDIHLKRGVSGEPLQIVINNVRHNGIVLPHGETHYDVNVTF